MPTTTRIATIIIIIRRRRRRTMIAVFDAISAAYKFPLIILICESWYVRLVFHIVQPQQLHRSLAIIDTFDHSCRRNLTHFVFVRFYETQSGTNCRSNQPTNLSKKKIKTKKAEKNLDGLSVLPCSLSIVYSILINSFRWIFSRHAALIISEDFFFVGR